MPKIDVYKKSFFQYLGRRIAGSELETLLEAAKAELDGDQEDMFRIELNDTNRPDLWSTVGLVRQLQSVLQGKIPEYNFFSTPNNTRTFDNRVIVVDSALQQVRPYIAGFEFRGSAINDDMLKDLIQIQEKLTENYGRRRKTVAMGMYRAYDLQYPIHYRTADPDKEAFQPLEFEQSISLRRILSEHPKGKTYSYILQSLPSYPMLNDSSGRVLSMPPIINSADLGKVDIGDDVLFVELTGTDLYAVLLCCSIVACAVADMSYEVLPVQVRYPYDTALGREIVTPCYFQEKQRCSMEEVEKLLGKKHSKKEVERALLREGIRAQITDNIITAEVPPYRNDFLHPVDLVEEIMIGNGLNTYKPEMPTDFTIGRISPVEQCSRRVKSLMVGLGYQEMVFNYLGSGRDYIERIYPRDQWEKVQGTAVRVENPVSEGFEYIRFSALPSLLSAESVSGNASYPHQIFEVGKVAQVDPSAEDGIRTSNMLAFLCVNVDADFNIIHQHISVLLYYMCKAYSVHEHDDARFIPGRCAVLRDAEAAEFAVFGELHPRVLEQWGLQNPAVFAECCLDYIID